MISDSATTGTEPSAPDPIILDPEGLEQGFAQASKNVIDAALRLIRQSPYGIIPDPREMANLRRAVKAFELVYAEVEVTSKLMALADSSSTTDQADGSSGP